MMYVVSFKSVNWPFRIKVRPDLTLVNKSVTPDYIVK